VALEIELFRALHPDRPILAALYCGEPAEAFPPALLSSGPDRPAIEPLAADFRSGGDGARHALLKLVSGIVGLRLDELVQRDLQRRVRRVTTVTVAAVIGMLMAGGLAIYALQARAEAERRREQAEGLVEFMLTDLRDRLKGVGRLDVMSAVNARALAYYRAEDLAHLPPDSLMRRAHVLQEIGEDDQLRGDLAGALGQFEEAHRITGALLDAKPNDPDRIYAHAQSEFWIGSVAFTKHEREPALRSFRAYSRLADQLVAINPKNPVYLNEAHYADGNLCAAELLGAYDAKAAIRYCQKSLAELQAVIRLQGDNPARQKDLAFRHHWMAEAYRANGQLDLALQESKTWLEVTGRLRARDAKNVSYRADACAAEMHIAINYRLLGNADDALAHAMAAKRLNDELEALDPANEEWRSVGVDVDKEIRLSVKLKEKSARHDDHLAK
jgi:tetratricopeptide (TPR) repeat protein